MLKKGRHNLLPNFDITRTDIYSKGLAGGNNLFRITDFTIRGLDCTSVNKSIFYFCYFSFLYKTRENLSMS